MNLDRHPRIARRRIGRVVRQLLAECCVLAVLGGGAGIALAYYALQFIVSQMAALPIAPPHLQTAALNGRVLIFNTVLFLLLACVFSFAPVFLASKRTCKQDHDLHPERVLTMRVPIGTRTQPRPTGKYDTKQKQIAFTSTISPQYFPVMGIPLLAGRTFSDADQATSPCVSIVNEYFARQLFPIAIL